MEYDGSGYFGFQFQPNQPTIQSELEEALFKLTGEKKRVVAASRTDTGVHASGQVVCLRTGSSLPLAAFVGGVNYYLPEDIAVKSAHRVEDTFHVQRDAVCREYRYSIWNDRTRSPLKRSYYHLVPAELNLEEMNRACQVLIGEQDLASFVTSLDGVKSTMRTIHKAQFTRQGKLVLFDITAKSFLPHQVRNTVGALLNIGRGKMSTDEFTEILHRKKPGLAGPTAPACGLCLMQVYYPTPF